jgi:hypothetical protein
MLAIRSKKTKKEKEKKKRKEKHTEITIRTGDSVILRMTNDVSPDIRVTVMTKVMVSPTLTKLITDGERNMPLSTTDTVETVMEIVVEVSREEVITYDVREVW